MAPLSILPATADALWAPAAEVTNFLDQVCPHVDEMQYLMRKHNGIGLAAPQCGIPFRFFIFGGRRIGSPGVIPFTVVVNPFITFKSLGMRDSLEGCLSFPGKLQHLDRHDTIRVQYQTLTWHRNRVPTLSNTHERFHAGHISLLFQHEIDHLNGVCIFERQNPAEKKAEEIALAETVK